VLEYAAAKKHAFFLDVGYDRKGMSDKRRYPQVSSTCSGRLDLHLIKGNPCFSDWNYGSGVPPIITEMLFIWQMKRTDNDDSRFC
jgi:hypothetical protein